METKNGPGAREVLEKLYEKQGFSPELAKQMAGQVLDGKAVLSQETRLPDGGKLGVSIEVDQNRTGRDEKDSNSATE